MDSRKENKRLIGQYPFMLPWGTDSANFESTELDIMPTGWRIAFGEELCKEIMEELTRNNCVDSYRIVQIKEKHGALRWYAQGGTERIHREIVPKFEKLSRRICIQCGRPATLVSLDWIAPRCDACAEQFPHLKYVDIDAIYGSKDGIERDFFVTAGTADDQKVSIGFSSENPSD